MERVGDHYIKSVYIDNNCGWPDSPQLGGSPTSSIKFDCHRGVFVVAKVVFFTENRPSFTQSLRFWTCGVLEALMTTAIKKIWWQASFR